MRPADSRNVRIRAALGGLLLLLLGVPTLFSQGLEPLVQDVVKDTAPEQSSWVGERLQAQIGARVGQFSKAWNAGDRKAAVDHLDPTGLARSTSLLPAAEPTQFPGGLSIRRVLTPAPADADQPLAAALAHWLAPFDGTPVRLKVKVLSSEPTGTEIVTRIRVEFFASLNGLSAQQTNTWQARWEVRDPEFVLLRLALIDFEEVTSRGLLTDCTESLLAAGDPVLSRGGDYWLDRTDQIGESPLMAHHGIAVGDVNGDGLEDIYVACPTGIPNRLYLRQPSGTFVDGAHKAGVGWLDDTKGVLLVDMDGDGDLDLWCAMANLLVLCVNKGDGTFGPFVGINAATPSVFYGLSAADFDLDGDLDLYAVRYVEGQYGSSIPMPLHDANNGPSNILIRNDGNLRFSDVTSKVGLDQNNRKFSLIGVWEDYDQDGDPDLYVTNDFGRNNLYRNDGGKFVDVAAAAGVEDQAASMGATFGDVDGDGFADLYVTNMFSSAGLRIATQDHFQKESNPESRAALLRHAIGNTLFRNLGDGRFEDVSDTARVRMGRWGWGALFVDLNLDGRLDIYAPNGFVTGPEEADL